VAIIAQRQVGNGDGIGAGVHHWITAITATQSSMIRTATPANRTDTDSRINDRLGLPIGGCSWVCEG